MSDPRADGARAARRRVAVIDHLGTLPGRGAYLCRGGGPALAPDAACLRRATRRNAIARALRHPAQIDLGELSAATPELVES